MAAQKIVFTPEDYAFMLDFKEATNTSIQKFVSLAIKEKIEKTKTEQIIKDLLFNQK